MLQKVKEFINVHHMIRRGDKIAAGISGGADSVCLFFVLLSLMEEYGFSFMAVHVNHGLRGEEADADEAFVDALCKKHGILFMTVKKPVREIAAEQSLCLEEAGRLVRYGALEDAVAQYGMDKIAMAHNRNDQGESVLLNLFRGSGIRGLSGMSPVNNNIIRPLLCVERTEIENYLYERNIAYRTDKSNFSDVYTRNKIRIHLLPYIGREINTKALDHIVKAAGMVKEADEYIEKNSILAFNRMVRTENGKYFINANELSGSEFVIRKRVLRMILERLAGGLKNVESEHIDMLLALVGKQVGKQAVLPYGICVERTYEELAFTKKEKSGAVQRINGQEPMKVEIPGEYRLEGGYGSISFGLIDGGLKKVEDILKNDYTKWFDYDKIKNTIFLRNRQEGDYLQIDKAGNCKKLKSYFIDRKIPRQQRSEIPLLADGNHIMWVMGGRISEAYRVDENTRRILKVQMNGG